MSEKSNFFNQLPTPVNPKAQPEALTNQGRLPDLMLQFVSTGRSTINVGKPVEIMNQDGFMPVIPLGTIDPETGIGTPPDPTKPSYIETWKIYQTATTAELPVLAYFLQTI